MAYAGPEDVEPSGELSGKILDFASLKGSLSAYQAERRFAKLNCESVGFYPFRRPYASLTCRSGYYIGTPISLHQNYKLPPVKAGMQKIVSRLNA